MNDIVIRVEGLGKKYMIGHQASGRERYTALRDVVGRQARSIVRSARDMVIGRQMVAGDEIEEFWALKDVSFEIRRGDVVGIIGRNGAGKSTLLKVLSRITEPSTGRVEIKGRVASLLEVGTGFHPELTGRENIYLNGAILGMTRAEIRKKFDEIVAFAEVQKFLDTPVKRYSSGMYVRLAFSVAAHLEPEVLIVDEVLAVGDAEFQRKCLGKMQDVAGEGRTVLFVSHNIGALATLCQSGLLLASGALVAHTEISTIIGKYQLMQASPPHGQTDLPGGISIAVSSVGHRANRLDELIVELSINTKAVQTVSDLSILIYSEAGTRVAIADLRGSLKLPIELAIGNHTVTCAISPALFVDTTFDIRVYVGTELYNGNTMPLAKYIPPTREQETVPYLSINRGFFDLRVNARLSF